MKNIKGRSVRLDIYATDSQGKKYNIDIQPAGVEVENLADTYVIFITETDVIGKRYYKEDEEGIFTMCKAMEDMITDEKKEIALRLIETGKLSLKEIADCSDLSLEEVQKLADEELQPV